MLLLALVAGPVVLVAGSGLVQPFGVDFDRAGRTYIVEYEHRVSMLDAKGALRVLAGNGVKGFAATAGPRRKRSSTGRT